MAGKLSVENVLTDAAKIVDVWKQNPTFPLGEINLPELEANIARVREFDAGVESTRTTLTGLMDRRDDEARSLNDIVTRARSGFRAIYGPDSPQYAQAGGTRRSERKAPTRRAPKPKEL